MLCRQMRNFLQAAAGAVVEAAAAWSPEKGQLLLLSLMVGYIIFSLVAYVPQRNCCASVEKIGNLLNASLQRRQLLGV